MEKNYSNRRLNPQPQLARYPSLWLLVCAALLALVAAPHALAANNGLARTPPMGWSSWNYYGCSADEAIVEQIASTIASNGMKAAGYEYINLDDCWMASSRDANGNLVADPTKFPDGMAAVATYVHSLGLKLGLYEDMGTATCAGYPGSYGYYQQDIATYVSWGIDYIKMDWCSTSGLDPQTIYTEFAQDLAAAKANIDFSMCEWGDNSPWTWGPAVGNSWRTTSDISDSWSAMITNLESNAAYAPYAGPGGWNDPDMLEVGNGGMTAAQDQAHFAMWAMSAAPLIAGNDLLTMSSATLATLTNAAVIAVDQDPLGIQGSIVYDNGAGLQVWAKPVTGGTAVALLNNTASAASITVTWTEAGLSSTQSVSVTDLWAGTNLGNFTGSYTASVPADDAAMLMLGGTGASCATVPSAPAGLTGTAVSASVIKVSFTADTAPANCTISSYNVFRGTTNGFTPSSSNLIASGTKATSYLDTSLTASTTYYYVVEAVDSDGTSAASAQASAETLSGAGGSFTLAPSTATLSVAKGSSGTDVIAVTDVSGFSGSVTLAASGLPSGVTAAFTTNPTTSTSVLTLTASSSAASGTSTVTITGTSGTLTATTTIALTVGSFACNIVYAATTQSTSAFSGAITIDNTGTLALTSWVLTWTYANGQTITSLWNGVESQSGANVKVASESYNGSIAAGGNYAGMGFDGSWNGVTNAVPTNFAINGVACTVNGAAATPGFTLAASPTALSLVQGGTGTANVTVSDTGGFTGSITLAATGLPSGVTVAYGTNPATATSVLTFTASATATVGSSTVTITGTSGTLTASTTIALTVSAKATASFTLSRSASTLSVTQGSSGTDTITVTDLNGFTGNVTLAASGLPSGVTAAFATNPTASTSVLTLTASSTAAAGTSTVTVTGTSGSLTATTTIALTVSAKATASFTLSRSASTLSVTQGSSGTDTITVTDVNGFTGSVAFSASGLPSGVTASFSPTSSTSSTVLTLTASSTATVGTSTIPITGTSGTTTATTTIALTVAPSGGACTVDYVISPQNSSAFGASITIVNGPAAITSWTLTWTFANGQTVASFWNGIESQSGANVTVKNESYNGSIAANGTLTGLGFNGTWNGVTNAIPTAFSLNGTACTVN
ncbi:MAG: cellulose binding domain-containing protein [Terracidiphilus sp.]